MGVLLAFSFVFLFSFAFSLAESAPLSVVTGATVGISRALGYVLWQQVFSLQPHKPMAIEVVLGSSLAGGAFFFVTWFPPAGVCVLSLVLAIINCTGLFALFSLIPDVPRTTSAVQPATGAIATCVRGNWVPVLVMSLLGFLWGVFAILATQYNPGGFLSSLYAIGRLAAALLIFIYLARVSFKIDLNVLFKLLVPLCITTVLLYPLLGEETSTCIATVYYAVFGIASIAMIIACAAMSHTFKLHPSTVYCLFFGFIYLSSKIGLFLGRIFTETASTMDDLTFELSIALASVYLFAMLSFFLQKRHAARNEESTKSSPPSEKPTAAQVKPVFATLSSDPFDGFGLTPREQQIASLLVRGRDVAYICDELMLSKNTVRSHIKSVYQKTGVHSKQELINLSERRASDPASKSS